MQGFIESAVLLGILLAVAFVLYKRLSAHSADSDGVRIRSVGGSSGTNSPSAVSASALPPQGPPADDVYQAYSNTPAQQPISRRRSIWLPLLFVGAAGYLLYANHESLTDKVQSVKQPTAEPKARQNLSSAEVSGHAVVEGVNWIKIVATSSEGIPFEGWVSELAIQKEPPKENPNADAFMKKIGLPTNRERLEGIKSLRKIGDALKTANKNDQFQSQ